MQAKTPSARPLRSDETELLTDLLTAHECAMRTRARDASTRSERVVFSQVADEAAALRDQLYANKEANEAPRRAALTATVEAALGTDAYGTGEEVAAYRRGGKDNATGRNSIADSYPYGPLRSAYIRGWDGLPY